MNNIIASLLLPILLCQSVIATQKKYCGYKPKKNEMSGVRRCAVRRLTHTFGSFRQRLSRLDLCKARSKLSETMLTNSQTPDTALKNSLGLLFRGINVGRFTFSQCSPEGRLLIMMIYFPKHVIKWSKMKVLHKAIGRASEDDVCSVAQKINDELGKFVCNPGISVCWALLPKRPK